MTDIERAMVAMRRSWTRRTLHRRQAAAGDPGAGSAEGHRTRREAVEAALAGWSGEDRETFARLLRDYVAGWEQATARRPR